MGCASKLLPLAVMFDNTSNAKPHSGLDRADLVYEASVEGGITRLMAVLLAAGKWASEPIRSARTPSWLGPASRRPLLARGWC